MSNALEQAEKNVDEFIDREQLKNNEDQQQEPTDELSSVILDHGLDLISRPIALIKDKGYIATWVDMKIGKETMRNVLCILNQDGEIFTAEDAPGNDIKDLNIPVDLPLIVESKRRLSGKGLKKYLDGQRPDPVNVFERLRDYFDYFMDFDLSFSPQSQMSELSACYAMSTFLTDAFSVIGYLWPNGETGSGKTHYLITMAQVSYMGQVILAGGTFSSLRDLASYGATLCFDDAEKIMDNKMDPDKQALLLAGNRKGTTVTFKEQVKNHKWQNKNVHVYCPRLFSAIRLPAETLINRSIIIPLVASGDNRKSNSDPMDYESWPEGIDQRELVDDLWMMALANISTIYKYDRLTANMSQINGRAYQPWRSIHTVAHWLTELGADGLYDRMIKVTADYRKEGDLLVPDTKIKLITEALRELYTGKGGVGEITIASKEICSKLTMLARENDLIDEDDKHYISPRSLGWKLKHMRLKKPEKRSRQVREWIIDEGTLQRLERPYKESEKGIITQNKTSQTSQNVKTSQNSDVSPENDVKDVKDVLSESDSGLKAQGENIQKSWNSGNGGIPHEKTQEVTALKAKLDSIIESILDELGKPITVDMVLNELVPDDYQYLIDDIDYARGFVKTLSERLAP